MEVTILLNAVLPKKKNSEVSFLYLLSVYCHNFQEKVDVEMHGKVRRGLRTERRACVRRGSHLRQSEPSKMLSPDCCCFAAVPLSTRGDSAVWSGTVALAGKDEKL